MPSPLRFFRTDPNKKGRGTGIYYLRAKGYYSMYDIERDRRKKSKGWRKNIVGSPKKSSILHTGDGVLPR